MGYRLRGLVGILCALSFVSAQAARWTTHFAYNNVTQIAMASDKVFAVSDGSMFSVDKQTEQVRSTAESLAGLRTELNAQLGVIREQNAKEMGDMRAVVDKQLHENLE